MPLASAETVEDVVRILDTTMARADDLQRKHLVAAGVELDVIAETMAIHRIERRGAFVNRR